MSTPIKTALYGLILAFGLAGPFLFPAYTFQLAMLWLMIVFALTWDILGGQMGYNSLGNILFFGVGMYACAVTQIGLFHDVAQYTSPSRLERIDFTEAQYFSGLAAGLIVAALVAVVGAIAFGWIVFGLRGPYFAIGTLGVAIAAGELFGTWDYVGAGSGITSPNYPRNTSIDQSLLYYFLLFSLAVAVFLFVRWLYSTRFGLALNAIRDDEGKAEGMGLHTKRYKTIAWAIAAFFLGISGGIYGNMNRFFEPLEVAFPTVTFGIFMVLMVLLGGKGTLWGPVVGAVVFHVIKELTWTYLLGWQWVTLGALIIIIVVFFQQGIVGWMMEQWPALFGIAVEERAPPADSKAPQVEEEAA